MTPSQKRRVDEIRKYYEKTWAGKELGIGKNMLKISEYGDVYLAIRTKGNSFVMQGGFFQIGKRGGVKSFVDHTLFGDALIERRLKIKC